MGTVMEFNDGKPRRVLVLDAKYRTNRRFGSCKYSPLNSYPINPGTGTQILYLNPTDMTKGSNMVKASVITDLWINTNVVKDPNTAKQNCDAWMTRKGIQDSYDVPTIGRITGVPAVEYCRSIYVNGVPCDLPNIQTLARIYCDGNSIDSMDISKDTHSIYLFGSSNPQGAWWLGTKGLTDGYELYSTIYYTWSSTVHIQETQEEGGQGSTWNISAGGRTYTTFRYSENAVVPVLEL